MGLMGGKRVAGLGGLGEWVSGGRLTAGDGKVAGRACPAPTGWQSNRLCTSASGHGGLWAGRPTSFPLTAADLRGVGDAAPYRGQS